MFPDYTVAIAKSWRDHLKVKNNYINSDNIIKMSLKINSEDTQDNSHDDADYQYKPFIKLYIQDWGILVRYIHCFF